MRLYYNSILIIDIIVLVCTVCMSEALECGFVCGERKGGVACSSEQFVELC